MEGHPRQHQRQHFSLKAKKLTARAVMQLMTPAQRLVNRPCAQICTRSQPGTMPASSGVRLSVHVAARFENA